MTTIAVVLCNKYCSQQQLGRKLAEILSTGKKEKRALFFSQPFAEHNRQNCHLQLVLRSLLLFLYKMTYPTLLHGFKIEGLPMAVLLYSR